jgi:hypothetical protein
MVMIGRFSSDDPGWREPWDRDTEPAGDDADWPDLNPHPRRTTRRGAQQRGTGPRNLPSDSDLQESRSSTSPNPES